jgi:uncharacterized phage infection (PIP) family protein YhgE
MRPITVISIAAFAGLFLALVSATAYAQSAPSPSSPAGKTDMGEIAKSLGDDALKLKQETERGLQRLDELEGQLRANQQNTANAKKTVEELLSLLREGADRLAPARVYRSTLKAEEDTVRDYANRAAANTDSEIRNKAGWFKDRADEIAAIQSEAEQLRTRLISEIDRLEKQKVQLEFAVAATQIEQFIKNAHEYLDTVSKMATGAKNLADKIGNTFGTNQPTQ